MEERVMEGLEGKTALITGGAGGIGSTISEALLESGVRVFLHDLPTSDGAAKARSLCQRFGDGRAVFVGGDLNALPALAREGAKLAAEVDGIDFLVNNAAVDPVAPIEAYSIEEFVAVQTINAHAAFVLCQTLAPYMKRKSAGAIVNVLSVVLSGDWPEKVPYAMSKGALLGLTRSLARELGPHNIRVNGAFTEENFCRDRLSAVIVFAPLAAMADSVHAGRGVSHSRHIRHSRNAQKKRAGGGAEHMPMRPPPPAAPKS